MDRKSNCNYDKNSIFPCGFESYDEILGYSVNEPIMVAFSGGADSRALFDLTYKFCKEKGTYFYACHVNHGIRGKEALRDRDFCIDVAKNCPLCKEIFVLNEDVPSLAKKNKLSLELQARMVRYDFFEKVMKENSVSILATAHNSDDNLETVLFNLTRGSGIKGMCGIPKTRDFRGMTIVRPVLSMSKKDILQYCKDNSLSFVTDSTNSDTEYSRNLIRHKIVPLLEEINRDVKNCVLRMSDSMKSMDDYAYSKAQAFFSDCEEKLTLKKLQNCPDAVFPYVMNLALKKANLFCELEYVHIKAIKNLCYTDKNGAKVSLPNRISAFAKDGELVFAKDGRAEEKDFFNPQSFVIKLNKGENILPNGDKIYIADGEKYKCENFTCETDSENGNIYKFATKLTVKSATIDSCLYARFRSEGDKIYTKGMHKSVKKLMCDKKIPIDFRDSLPLICNENEIIFIPYVACTDGIYEKNSKYMLIYVSQHKFNINNNSAKGQK